MAFTRPTMGNRRAPPGVFCVDGDAADDAGEMSLSLLAAGWHRDDTETKKHPGTMEDGQQECFAGILDMQQTLEETHMEPENRWFVEESSLPKVHFQVPC